MVLSDQHPSFPSKYHEVHPLFLGARILYKLKIEGNFSLVIHIPISTSRQEPFLLDLGWQPVGRDHEDSSELSREACTKQQERGPQLVMSATALRVAVRASLGLICHLCLHTITRQDVTERKVFSMNLLRKVNQFD